MSKMQSRFLRSLCLGSLGTITLPFASAWAITPLFDLAGTDTDGELGGSVAAVGDLDGDGVEDIAVGATGIDAVLLVSGVDGSELFRINGPAATYFGASVAGLGDLNGDGVSDLAVGAPAAASEAGAVTLFDGATGMALAPTAFGSAGSLFGWQVRAIGDVNSDGVGDVLAAAPSDNTTGISAGSASVISGATGLVIRTASGSASENFGFAITGLDDLDGDGVGEYAVGAPNATGITAAAGQVEVFSGATGATITTLTGGGDTVTGVGDRFGHALDGGEDIDGDGVGDLLVGAPNYSLGVSDSRVGAVSVYSGASLALVNQVFGKESSEYFGSSVSTAGDMNGDGLAEFAGANLENSVSVWYGGDGSAEFHGSQMWESVASGNYGVSMDSIDTTGDGISELIIGAPFAMDPTSGAAVGAVSLISPKDPSLAISASRDELTVADGVSQTIYIDFGDSKAGSFYVILGSTLSCDEDVVCTPGASYGGLSPFTEYFGIAYSLLSMTDVFSGFFGFLDDEGRAIAQLNIPNDVNDQSLVDWGKVLHNVVVPEPWVPSYVPAGLDLNPSHEPVSLELK